MCWDQADMPLLRSFGRLAGGFYKHVAPTALRLGSHTWRIFQQAVRFKLLISCLAALVAVVASVVLLCQRHAPSTAIRELRRDALELRDGALFAKGESKPFDGVLFEKFDANTRKLAIEIHHGKADGLSRGWFENGQLEVEEHFAEGMSHGLRTRWHTNGQKRSETQIEHGKLEGRYTEWHDNGQKAIEMTLANGVPEGGAEAWHPSGVRKSHTTFQSGEIVAREFFDDPSAPATVAVTTP